MDIELRSAMLLSSVLIGMMSVVLFFLRNSYPSSVRGIGEWATALAIIFVGNALFGFRDQLPDFLTAVAANALVMVGLTMLYFGTQHHFDRPVLIRGWLGLGAAIGALLIWFSVVSPSYPMRLGLMAAFMTCSLIAHSRLILRFGSASFPNRFTALLMAIQATVIAARLISLFFNDPIQHFYEYSLVQSLYLTSFVFSGVLISIGLTLMASNHLREGLEHLARHDSLTGCLNRRAWLDICDQEMDRSIRSGRQMTVLMMDLDHFKKINDSYGHQIGDRVIADFVKNASGALRRADSLGRYGGEEFVALLPETGAEQALIVAERLRSAVELATDVPGCTVSIGVATSDVNVSVDGLLARADEAMYRAKRGGRNRVETA